MEGQKGATTTKVQRVKEVTMNKLIPILIVVLGAWITIARFGMPQYRYAAVVGAVIAVLGVIDLLSFHGGQKK